MSAEKRIRLLSTIIGRNNDDENEEVVKALDMLEHPTMYDNKQASILAETIRSTLLEIARVKEINQERRHKELMELLEKYLSQENATDSAESKADQSADVDADGVPQSQVSSAKDTTTLADVRQLLQSSSTAGKTSEEFAQMRAEMLELQRQKMAERKNKKRKLDTK